MKRLPSVRAATIACVTAGGVALCVAWSQKRADGPAATSRAPSRFTGFTAEYPASRDFVSVALSGRNEAGAKLRTDPLSVMPPPKTAAKAWAEWMVDKPADNAPAMQATLLALPALPRTP